jgi:fermentation-respiration switch protein FrsA (DUF1100 family)
MSICLDTRLKLVLIDVRAVSVKNKHTTAAKLVVPKKQTPTRRVGTLPAHASDFLRTSQQALNRNPAKSASCDDEKQKSCRFMIQFFG